MNFFSLARCAFCRLWIDWRRIAVQYFFVQSYSTKVYVYKEGTHSFTALAPLAIKMWIGREFVCFKLDVDYSTHQYFRIYYYPILLFCRALCRKDTSRAGKLGLLCMRKPKHTRSRVREKLRVGKGAMSHGEGVPPKCRQLVNDPSMHSSISWGCGEYDPPSSFFLKKNQAISYHCDTYLQ